MKTKIIQEYPRAEVYIVITSFYLGKPSEVEPKTYTVDVQSLEGPRRHRKHDFQKRVEVDAFIKGIKVSTPREVTVCISEKNNISL